MPLLSLDNGFSDDILYTIMSRDLFWRKVKKWISLRIQSSISMKLNKALREIKCASHWTIMLIAPHKAQIGMRTPMLNYAVPVSDVGWSSA